MVCAVCQQLLKKAFDMHIPLAAPAGVQVELKIRIGRCRLSDMIERAGRQRRASQIRVQDDPRCINQRPQRVAHRVEQLSFHGVFDS